MSFVKFKKPQTSASSTPTIPSKDNDQGATTYFTHQKQYTDPPQSINNTSQQPSMYTERRQSSYPLPPQRLKSSIMKLPIIFSPLRSKATKAMKLGDHQETLRLLNELILTYPDNYQTRCDRAEIYQQLENYLDAIDDLNYATEIKPTKARAFYLRGLIFKEMNELGAARKDLSMALIKDSNDPRALDSLKICAQINIDEESLESFEKAICNLNDMLKLDERNIWALHKRGDIYFRQKKYSEVVTDMDKALFIEPNNVDFIEMRGTSLGKLLKYSEAMKDFNKALELDDNNPRLLLKRSKIFRLQNKYQEGLKNIEMLLLMGVELDFNILRTRGKIYRGLCRYKEALSDFNAALKQKQKYSIYVRRAEIHKILRQYDEALNDLNQALSFNPDHSDQLKICDMRNQVYSQSSKFKEALEGLNSVLSISPKNVNALSERGKVYRATHRLDEALNDLNKALTINSKCSLALLYRSKIYRDQNNFTEALTDLNAALGIDPKNAQILRNRGKILTLKKEHDMALRDLNNSLKSEEHSSALRYQGKNLSKLKKYDLAIKSFNKALQMKPTSGSIFYDRGESYFNSHKYKDALEDMNKSLEFDENPKSFELRSLIYMQLNDYKNALADTNRVLHINAKDVKSLKRRANLLEKSQRFHEALDDWLQIKRFSNDKAEPEYLKVLENCGRLLFKLCRYDEALEIFDESLVQAPDNLAFICYRAKILQEQKNYDVALNELDAAMGKQGDKCGLFVMRGAIYKSMKRYKESLQDLNKALKFKSENGGTDQYFELQTEAYCYRGSIYRSLRKNNEALTDLNTALNRDPDNIMALCERSSINRDRARYDDAWKDIEMVLSPNIVNEISV
ncbi:19903_t:CDS:1 [Funneliformis geosporum]|uniref:8090_t:CDS:1 n=1 Tax=Funneliformis geosporum TaxID=1117311 RepID=A0A9W4WNS9_9GLOM|nr:19903_t:CDS:1 [Funneliformis geosporum]CAI2175332.1 8090_t:CDS:1 [Funneliformis geosporum]